MEWFRDDGCLTDEGLRALTASAQNGSPPVSR